MAARGLPDVRVLHLFSNCKWTGPAEPALNLCVALRALGVEADFACAPDAGKSLNRVVSTARERGIEPVLRLHLLKHRHPYYNWVDQRRLAALLRQTPYDLIHCHLDNDHAIAGPVAVRMRIPVVRSSYHGEGLRPTRRNGRLLRAAACLIEASETARNRDIDHFHLDPAKVQVVPGAVDTRRFDPGRTLPDARARLGIPPEAFVAGIVARMQTHRHYEDLFSALRRVVDLYPQVHLVVVGRGTKQEEVGFAPVRALGLQAHVHFTGYLDGDDYVAALAAFDCGVFLVPGSDGTCRAVREQMALGKPMLVADRGMLREIVAHEVNGIVCDGSVEALARTLMEWAKAPERLRVLSVAARETALAHYSLEAQGAAVLRVYHSALHACEAPQTAEK
jgi:glycosyltransferase involved in cell wall biosynthesis